MGGTKYGSGLTPEARLARLEQIIEPALRATPRVWTIDSRATTSSGTTTTSKIIAGNGVSADFNSSSGFLGLVAVDTADYDIPDGYKMQVRGVWTYGSSADSGRDWLFGLFGASSISGGVITTGATYDTATIGSSLGANTMGEIATDWADVSSTAQLFAAHSPTGGSATNAIYVSNRIEARIVPA